MSRALSAAIGCVNIDTRRRAWVVAGTEEAAMRRIAPLVLLLTMALAAIAPALGPETTPSPGSVASRTVYYSGAGDAG